MIRLVLQTSPTKKNAWSVRKAIENLETNTESTNKNHWQKNMVRLVIQNKQNYILKSHKFASSTKNALKHQSHSKCFRTTQKNEKQSTIKLWYCPKIMNYLCMISRRWFKNLLETNTIKIYHNHPAQDLHWQISKFASRTKSTTANYNSKMKSKNICIKIMTV